MPLNVLPSEPGRTIRRSKSAPRRAAVLVLVHLAIAAHITHWLVSGRTVTPVEPSEAAAFANSGIVNTGLVFFAAMILVTAVFGRFFCGWACHLVALQDGARSLLARFGRRPTLIRSRLLAWVPWIACLYAFVWPAVRRYLATDSLAVTATEFTTGEFWATFPGWVVGGLTFLICGVATVYFLGAKGFCTYACPYGALFSAAEKVAPLRIRVTDACEGCGHCTAVCTSNVRVHEEVRDFGMVVDSGCMKCLDCVSVCPNDALYYGVGRLPFAARGTERGRVLARYSLTLGEELVAGGSALAAFLVVHGLYGMVPFLLALGIAGLVGAWMLIAWRLWKRRDVTLKSWPLKRKGVVQLSGWVFLALVAALTVIWGHSAVVRWSEWRGEQAVRATAAYQGAVFDLTASPAPLPAALRQRAAEGAQAYARAAEIGLMASRGATARAAALNALVGREEAARRLALAAIETDELAARMHLLLGRYAFEAGDGISARDRFEKAAAADPHESRAWTNLGVVAVSEGDLAGARRAFQRQRVDFGDSPAVLYHLGLVSALEGDLDAAIAGFRATLDLDPRHLPALENLAGTLAAAGDLEESAAAYERAVEINPRDAETRVRFADVLSMLGRWRGAEQQLRAAAEMRPGWPPVEERLAAVRREAESSGN